MFSRAFSRSSRVALSGSFDKIIFSVYSRCSSFKLIKSEEIFLRMAEQFVSLDKPIHKFIEDQKKKNTLSKTRRDVSLLSEFLNSKNESRSMVIILENQLKLDEQNKSQYV